MRIVTWNVNSIKAREDYVRLFLDRESPDVLCLQELKLETSKVPAELFEERGYHLATHGQKRWNGVLIASKEPLEEIHKGLAGADDGQARSISAVTGGIRLLNLYCPQGQSVDSPQFPFKLAFFDALRRWLDAHADPAEPLIVLGDLNIAPRPEDVWSVEAFDGVPSFHPQEHERWAQLLDFGLHDAVAPRVEPGTFTFWDYRGGAFHRNLGMRIDHVLVTEPLLPRISGARVERDWRKKKEGLTASDHAPVTVELS
ncbi:MAG: exodeoxyribonuclease III [bacterium]|nr:exodeoxyribonuclease III [bacterium]